jgi:arsenate reductase-like glutaredoxin family protein
MQEIILNSALVFLSLSVVFQAITIRRLSKRVDMLGEIVIKEKMVDMMKNLEKGLENLFNPKDETKKEGNKTRKNRQTK